MPFSLHGHDRFDPRANMNAYAPLLDRLRFGEPSMQRHAVVAIFEKLRSAPPHLGLSSDAGKEAISRCLLSTSAAVADQAIREICLLVKNRQMGPHLAFQELLAALEGCPLRFVGVFIKGIGFLCRFAFRSDPWWRHDLPETHPFIKVLSCRDETQTELLQQVILLVLEHVLKDFSDTALFIRPFIIFTFLQIRFSVQSTFGRQLISCMSSLSCSIFPQGISLFKILVECLGYIPCKTLEGFSLLSVSAECMVDAYSIILQHMEGREMCALEVQDAGAILLERLLSSCASYCGKYAEIEVFITMSKRLVLLQRNQGLRYMQRISSAIAYLFFILTKVEFEHEQLAILNLSVMLLDWRQDSEPEQNDSSSFYLREELLFIFPAIHLMASPAKSIRTAASDLLGKLERLLKVLLGSTNRFPVSNERSPHTAKTELLAHNFVQHLLLQDTCYSQNAYCLSVVLKSKFKGSGSCDNPNVWLAELRDHILVAIEKSKSASVSQPPNHLMTGMAFMLGAVVSVLIVCKNLQLSAIDTLASIAKVDPRLGLSLLLVVLFYGRIVCTERHLPEILIKLLTVLPSLGSHSAVSPLIIQTISPMLCKDVNPVLYAFAVRLLCQTWEVSNSVFEHLQGALHDITFLKFSSDSEICISIAASICDVCKKSADKGVDLILSVSACIESQAPSIQAFGLESLSYLCEADVVDFYTAWTVIMKHILSYSQDPIIAKSLAILLRWGAMDANVYPDASAQVLFILWEIASPGHINHKSEWLKSCTAALKSLSFYEVVVLQQVIPNFKDSILSWLTSESDPDLLKAMESLTNRLISSEHMTRRRFIREKKINVSKIDKLLDVLPRILFSSGAEAGEFPGAALICLPLSPKAEHVEGTSASKELADLRPLFEGSMLEIADSLQLSRNIFLAMLSLQSWRCFMLRWMRKARVLIGHKGSPEVRDKGFIKFANDILKGICELSNGSVPRRAENMALAIGALGLILPPSAHVVTCSASRFLLGWLCQFEHESRQWTSAISLGVLSSLLHVTDSKLKFEIAARLLEVTQNSKSPLVKGACGLGLGLACQDFFTRPGNGEDIIPEEGSHNLMEAELLGKLVRCLSTMIVQMCRYSSDSLERLCNFNMPRTIDHVLKLHEAATLGNQSCDSEDGWGIAGLAMGLGYSVIALHRAGYVDFMSDIKNMLMSWILHDHFMKGSRRPSVGDRMTKAALSMGACLVMPVTLAVFQKAEMLEDNEVEFAIDGYHSLLSQLLELKSFDAAQQSLLMASCVGAGGLLSNILSEGVFSLKLETVESLMNLMRRTYTGAYPPLVCLGGMVGVVNAMGAAAGLLVQASYQQSSLQMNYQEKGSSYIRVPMLTSSPCESLCTSLVQEMFLVVQDPKDQKLQSYSGWALSFLRHKYLSNNSVGDNTGCGFSAQTKPASQSFAEDSTVLRLSLWLMDLNFSEVATSTTIQTISTVLRCLGESPRLPPLDWGAIVRRCMRLPDCNNQSSDQDVHGGTLKEECLLFSFVHAKQATSLLCWLDEISDLVRFRVLRPLLQCMLLAHLADLVNIFSSSRVHKLWHDMDEFFTSSESPYLDYGPLEKSSLRMSFWKGLSECLTVTTDDFTASSVNLEKFMHLLFGLLPELPYGDVPKVVSCSFDREWSEAMMCLAEAHKGLMMAILQVEEMHPEQGENTDIIKKVIGRARLTMMDQLPVSELGILKSYLLSEELDDAGTWFMLLEAVAALGCAVLDDKHKWLLDAVEIICISKHPVVALRFLGLLSSCWSEYAPILVLCPMTVLSNLPATLPSLLSSGSWNSIAAPVVQRLWESTERLHNLMTRSPIGFYACNAGDGGKSKNEMDGFLVQVLHETCFNLKEYLPFEKQLKVANMKIM